MNFDEAVKAHSAWKLKLANYLAKPDNSLDPNKIRRDDLCEIGCWIHGEGRKFATTVEYRNLLSTHATFHAAAADVVKRANAGEKTSEEILLGAASPFANASKDVISAILKLKAAMLRAA